MTFSEFFNLSNVHFSIAILISIINAILLVFVARKFLQILQISGYKVRGYQVWLADTKAKYISRIALLSFLSLACVLVTNALFDVYNKEMFFSYLGLIFYIYFAIVFIVNIEKSPQKTPLVQTRRMSRLTTLLFLLIFVITLFLIWASTNILPFLRFGIVVLTPLILPFLVPLAHFIMIPLEELIRYRYICKAKKRLATRENDLIRIGITGSYGKTSIKHILNVMLSEKYNVCMTPHSFNTPMGLTKVVLKYLKPENNLLIAEMGAKQPNDIDYLCKLIKPEHGIITGISNQHYLSFGSEENILKTKNELVLALPEDAFVVFNGESDGARILFDKCTKKNKVCVAEDGNNQIKAENVIASKDGISFTLVKGKESEVCETVLLGEHNLQNILLSANLADLLGVSLKQIANAIKSLEPIKHRLEKIENGNVTVLDDAYSSNEKGAKAAVDTLALFKGEIKICVTPGLVELGKEERAVNTKFGEMLAGVCDYVIIVNKVNLDAIKEGLLASGMPPERILSVENLDGAKMELEKLFASSDTSPRKEIKGKEKKYVVLFENDLPDNYT